VEGNNSWVKLNKDNTLTISTPKVDDADAAPLQTFFPARDYISLLEVLSTVNRYSGFLDEFQHWQQRYHRPKPPQKTFYAGIIGLGCGIGTRKIARISRQISEPELENTVNWYFSPDATQAANDKVLNLMDRMELPNRYRRSQEVLHTSSDGQKFEVKVESLNANHSFKYFGKGKGVSVYSFIDERHLLFSLDSHQCRRAGERLPDCVSAGQRAAGAPRRISALGRLSIARNSIKPRSPFGGLQNLSKLVLLRWVFPETSV
jgi:hypothetical protein